MKQIETIKSGKNFTAVTAGSFAEIIEHELPMGPDFTLHGKVFLGQALGATGAELSFKHSSPDRTAASCTPIRLTKNFILSCAVRVHTKWMANSSPLVREP